MKDKIIPLHAKGNLHFRKRNSHPLPVFSTTREGSCHVCHTFPEGVILKAGLHQSASRRGTPNEQTKNEYDHKDERHQDF